jgi:RimJ/RimL family protein N-acetyltransferase
MSSVQHRDAAALEAGLAGVRAAPADAGALELIVRRPAEGAREVVAAAVLDVAEGLVGDNWKQRGSRLTPDGAAHPDMQLNVMSARAAALVAGERSRWPLAGDQLYVDLDVGEASLPAGARLAIGAAIIEVTAQPHLGCRKFSERFGAHAVAFVNSAAGRTLRLRGLNARIVQGGRIRTGDVVRRAGLGRAPNLATARLSLRPVTPADVATLHAHWSQPAVRRYLWDDRVPAAAEVTALVDASVASARAQGWCLWLLADAAGTFVGVAGLRESAHGAELLYSLEPAQWHRGYAQEAARTVLAYCFGPLGLSRVSASTDEPNADSVRVLERLGFHPTGREIVGGLPLRFFALESRQSK